MHDDSSEAAAFMIPEMPPELIATASPHILNFSPLHVHENSEDEQGHPALRRRPHAMAGVPPVRHP